MNKKICFGCGAGLQSTDKNKDGFIPENKEDAAYCQRCFKIMHYGVQSKSNTPKETLSIINSINKDNKFVIFLADFLSINSEVIDIFNKIKNDKVLVISKTDLILKSIKEVHIRAFLRDYYEIDSDIRFISSVNNFGVEALTDYLYRNYISDAYIVGLANAGKSTLINKLLEKNNSKLNKITTSYVANTTLDFIRIKISDDLNIIDSPGFVINTLDYTDKHSFKTPMKPKTFQMKQGETLNIDDMYLNFSKDTSVTLYLSKDLKVRKYFKEVEYDYDIKVESHSDLIISGLGFINIKKGADIKVSNINKELIELRESVFGHYE